ncbi:hydroxyacid dehydrogenase [Paenibacillus humicola]|uniref:hydroxyacid dehydrogenase n=1 Tax=Paenibacillus humicola TaxID=3110540 RepID=UPI00237B0D3F|nr:hydroxyacid dehydrogenase [Paenibacillus humicola]
MKAKALVLPPESRLQEVCSDACRALLEREFEPVWNETGRDYKAEELFDLVREAEVILTSWGSPALTEAMLERAPGLRAVGHAAGTVKSLVPRGIFARGVRVHSGAPRIAASVGEFCLAAMLACLRRLPEFGGGMRAGGWKIPGLKGRELAGSKVGIVSASSTARALIRLLAPFGVDAVVYDPYLTAEAAAGLGVRTGTLAEVMACPVISVHAPNLPATEGILTAELLARIPDGAVLVNSSRGSVFDEQALMAELQSGRFTAALDVFAREPLAADSPLRTLPNVLLTPHIAGATVEGHLALMEAVAADIVRGLAGEPTAYEVNERMWDVMA